MSNKVDGGQVMTLALGGIAAVVGVGVLIWGLKKSGPTGEKIANVVKSGSET